MKLQNVIAAIRQPEVAKTASETTPAAVPATNALTSALREAVATTPATKTASDKTTVSPVADVLKVASEIAGAEQEAAVKEAALLGAAFADAAVARFSDWQKAASQLPAVSAPVVLNQKQAAEAPQADEYFNKYAEENPILARQAISLGYAPTQAGLQKMAEDSYVQGYNDQVTEIHKTASEEFLKAAAVTALIIENAQKQA